MVDRTHRELTDDDLAKIAGAYHAWRGDNGSRPYADVPGFARSASIEDIRNHKYNLVPGRYVGFAERPGTSWDRSQLQAELEEILGRFGQADNASQSALKILQELLHG